MGSAEFDRVSAEATAGSALSVSRCLPYDEYVVSLFVWRLLYL
jgi:hypothetical protein